MYGSEYEVVLLGCLMFFFLLFFGMYIFAAVATSKALKKLGYARPWMAWIPLACDYAIADASCKERNEEGELVEVPEIDFFGFKMPASFFRICFLIVWALSIASTGSDSGMLTALALIAEVLFLSTVYGRMFALIEKESFEETRAIGIVSGFVPIVAWVKFLCY